MKFTNMGPANGGEDKMQSARLLCNLPVKMVIALLMGAFLFKFICITLEAKEVNIYYINGRAVNILCYKS